MDKSDGDESNQSSPKSPQLKQQPPSQQQQQQHKRRIKVSNTPEKVIDSQLVPNSIGLEQAAKNSHDDDAAVVKKRVNALFFFYNKCTLTYKYTHILLLKSLARKNYH